MVCVFADEPRLLARRGLRYSRPEGPLVPLVLRLTQPRAYCAAGLLVRRRRCRGARVPAHLPAYLAHRQGPVRSQGSGGVGGVGEGVF